MYIFSKFSSFCFFLIKVAYVFKKIADVLGTYKMEERDYINFTHLNHKIYNQLLFCRGFSRLLFIGGSILLFRHLLLGRHH